MISINFSRVLMVLAACVMAAGGVSAAAQTCTLVGGCPDFDTPGQYAYGSDYGTPEDDTDGDDNGVIDSWEMALFEAVLCSSAHPLRNTTICVFDDNLAEFRLEASYSQLASLENFGAGILALSTGLQTAVIDALAATTPLTRTYATVMAGGQEIFSAAYDIDGDGVSNGQEAINARVLGKTRAEYVTAALDPQLDGSECAGDIGACPDVIAEGKFIDPEYGDPTDSADVDDNGIIDSWEIRTFQAVVCSADHPLKAAAGCAFIRNRTVWDGEDTATAMAPIRNVAIAYLSLSPSLQAGILPGLVDFAESLGYLGYVFDTYETVSTGPADYPFAGDADLDGDGVSNAQEAANVYALGGIGQDYVAVVLDPNLDGSECNIELEECPDFIGQGRLFDGGYGEPTNENDGDDNGIIDSWEVRLFQAVLCDDAQPLHQAAVCAYQRNLTAWNDDIYVEAFAPIRDFALANLTISTTLQAVALEEGALLVGPSTQTYHTMRFPTGEKLIDEPFASHADLDGDGVTNGQEAANVYALGGTGQDYVTAALDPQFDGSECDLELPECPNFIDQGMLFDADFGTAGDTSDADDNGVIDSWEIRLFAAVLCDSAQSLHQETVCAYRRNLTAWGDDIYAHSFAPVQDYIVGSLSMSTTSQAAAIDELTNFLGAPTQLYETVKFPAGAKLPDEPFAADADLDGDGVTNGQEAANVMALGGTAQDYVAAALNPARSGGECYGFEESCPDFDGEGSVLYALLAEDWMTFDAMGDGIVDRWQVLAFAEAICAPDTPLDLEAACAFRRNRGVFRGEAIYPTYQAFENVIVALLTLSTETQMGILTTGLLSGSYEVFTVPGAKLPDEPFAADGDLDGDGVDNATEYQNTIDAGLTLEDFITATQHPLLDGSKPLSALPLFAWSALFLIIALSLSSFHVIPRETRPTGSDQPFGG